MAHISKVVEWREVSNGQIAVKIRCCDDPSTDHWHTMASQVAADNGRLMSSLATAHSLVTDQHDKHTKAKENLKKLVEEDGNSDSHGPHGNGH